MTPPAAQLQSLGHGVHAWLGLGGDSNAGCIETPDGVIVIDAQQHRGLATRFREAMAATLAKPLRILVNTHYHLDHVSGNIVFADLPILAHRATLTELQACLGPLRGDHWTIADTMTKLSMFYGANIQELVPAGDPAWDWFKQRVAPAEYEVIKVAPPTQTFADEFAFHLAGDTIHLPYWGPSHCVGHVPVIVERAKIAFMGDLLFVGRFPWLGDCDLDGWIAQLDRIARMDLDVVVPGHGPVAGLAEVASFRNLLAAIRSAVERAVKAGASEEAAIREVDIPEYSSMSRYREWMRFNVRAAYRYLKGEATPVRVLQTSAAQ